jgi:hypothetical protein
MTSFYTERRFEGSTAAGTLRLGKACYYHHQKAQATASPVAPNHQYEQGKQSYASPGFNQKEASWTGSYSCPTSLSAIVRKCTFDPRHSILRAQRLKHNRTEPKIAG